MCIDMVFPADFVYGLVAKTKRNAKPVDNQEHLVIFAYQRAHVVIRAILSYLIHSFLLRVRRKGSDFLQRNINGARQQIISRHESSRFLDKLNYLCTFAVKLQSGDGKTRETY